MNPVAKTTDHPISKFLEEPWLSYCPDGWIPSTTCPASQPQPVLHASTDRELAPFLEALLKLHVTLRSPELSLFLPPVAFTHWVLPFRTMQTKPNPSSPRYWTYVLSPHFFWPRTSSSLICWAHNKCQHLMLPVYHCCREIHCLHHFT